MTQLLLWIFVVVVFYWAASPIERFEQYLSAKRSLLRVSKVQNFETLIFGKQQIWEKKNPLITPTSDESAIEMTQPVKHARSVPPITNHPTEVPTSSPKVSTKLPTYSPTTKRPSKEPTIQIPTLASATDVELPSQIIVSE